MSSDERGPNPGHDHDEAKVMEELQASEEQQASEAPQFDDGDSPTTTDGQIRPAGVAPGDGMGHGFSSAGDGPEGEKHASGDEGGRAHTPATDGNAALDGSRSGRDLGGPKLAPEDVDDAEATTGGAKGDIRTKGQEPHE